MTPDAATLICPECREGLDQAPDAYHCEACGRNYPVRDGVPSFVAVSADEDRFNQEHFEFLFEMEQRHFWHVGRRELIGAVLRRAYGDRLGDILMIEIGCGNGSVLHFLKSLGVQIEGADLFAEALQFCSRRLDVPLYQADASRTPFADDRYQAVGLFDVIEHVEDDEGVLREMHRICTPGGRVIVTAPAVRWLWSYFDEMSGHKRRYTRNELRGKLERAGFAVEKLTFYMLFLFPVVAAFRLLKSVTSFRKSKSRDLSRSAEAKTIPLVNGLFLTALRLERRLVAHVGLPFGASLLAVARKV